MSTDFRALCAELTDVLAELPFGTCEELVVRARAALASPGSGLPQRPENFEFALDFLGGPENDELLAYVEQLEARAALMADGPAVQSREPASVVGEPSDEDLYDLAEVFNGDPVPAMRRALQLWARPATAALAADEDTATDEQILRLAAREISQEFSEKWFLVGPGSNALTVKPLELLNFARAVLARWGHQPAPPAAGEAGELVAWLRSLEDASVWFETGSPEAQRLNRAAELLAQRHPAPVPVGERLPGPGDCDAEGRCWWFCLECPGEHSYWILAKEVYCEPTYWLPAHALPLPAREVE